MTGAPPRATVLDTSVLSNFAQVDQIELLLDLPRVVTVDVVAEELAVGTETHPYLERAIAQLRTGLPVVTLSSAAEQIETELLQTLDPGEAQVLAVAEATGGVAVTDDGDARTIANRREVAVTGSIGLLVRFVEGSQLSADTADSYVNYPTLLPRRIRVSVLEGGALMWTPEGVTESLSHLN